MKVAWFSSPASAGVGFDFPKIELYRIEELGALIDHLRRLGKMDRRHRFGIAMTDGQLVEYARRVDPNRDIVLALKQGTRIEGVCQLSVYHCSRGLLPVADLGISVDAGWRRAGWAMAMLQEALPIARRRHVSRLVVQYLRHNAAMVALVRRLGDASEVRDGVEVTASVPLLLADSSRSIPRVWEGEPA